MQTFILSTSTPLPLWWKYSKRWSGGTRRQRWRMFYAETFITELSMSRRHAIRNTNVNKWSRVANTHCIHSGHLHHLLSDKRQSSAYLLTLLRDSPAPSAQIQPTQADREFKLSGTVSCYLQTKDGKFLHSHYDQILYGEAVFQM